MVLFYALLRMLAATLYKTASWRHGRAKKQLEKADALFRKIETSCKSDEVSSGRPADFMAQFKLMQQYEKRDKANLRWVKAAKRLNRRDYFAKGLAGFSGRKLPYVFGFVDMALIEAFVRPHWDWTAVQETFQRFI